MTDPRNIQPDPDKFLRAIDANKYEYFDLRGIKGTCTRKEIVFSNF